MHVPCTALPVYARSLHIVFRLGYPTGEVYQPTVAPTLTALGTAVEPTGSFMVEISPPSQGDIASLGESALVVRVKEVNCSDEYFYYFLEALVSSENVQ